MNAEDIASIPSSLLFETGTAGLRQWLTTRGQSLTLHELGTERARRSTTSQRSPHWADRRNRP